MSTTRSLKKFINYDIDRLATLLRVTAESDLGGPRHPLNILRVGYWFERLRWRLEAATAYALGKLIQPKTYQKSTRDHDAYHHNLWIRYAKGLVVPGSETIQAADALVPDSSKDLASAVWEILDLDRPLAGESDQWMRRLPPAVQIAVYDRRGLEAGRYRRRKSLPKTLEMLECQAANLDGIAALVILLREAHADHELERCFQIGLSLHATLLMACSGHPVGCIQLALIEYFVRFVFPLTSNGNIALEIDLKEFCELTFRFNCTILQLEDAGLIKAVNCGSTREWRKILHGQFGFDLQFAYAPRLKLDERVACPSESTRGQVAASRIGKAWGLAALREGRVERFVPVLVLQEMASALRTS